MIYKIYNLTNKSKTFSEELDWKKKKDRGSYKIIAILNNHDDLLIYRTFIFDSYSLIE